MTSIAHRAAEPSETAKPLLLFFYSATEGHSRRVEGYLAQVLQRRQNHQAFQLKQIDVRERPDLGERFRISSLPTLVVVADRRVKARLARPRNVQEIKQTLQPWLRG